MSRPFSPDSLSGSNGESTSTPSAASRRICRQLVVEAETQDEGVRVTLYCKVSLPSTASSSSHPHNLLTLLPSSRLTASSTYSLPLQDDSPEALAAARKIGILSTTSNELSLVQNGFDSPGARSLRRRRSSAASDLLSRMNGTESDERREIEVVQDGERVALRLMPEDGAVVSPPSGSPATERPTSRAGAATPTQAGQRNLEFLVVLTLEVEFGRLRLPRFAHTITVPTPLCLRNTLFFDLPSPPPSSAYSTWDLSVRPSLSNAQSTSHPAVNVEGTRISGTFPTTSSVSLRWAPQLADGIASLVIKRALLETSWKVDENGAATAEVEVSGHFEYSGLREKQWIEVEVGMPFVQAEGSPLDITGCIASDGITSILDWEVAPAPNSAAPSPHSTNQLDLPVKTPPELPSLPPLIRQPTESGLSDSAASVLSTSASTSYPFTPTPAPRRKRVSSRTSDPRPPSWTSLFDTAPPAPPVLDTSFSTESPSRALPGPRVVKEPSLLQQAAPFDPEASAMDMSFEVSSVPSTSSDLLDGPAVQPTLSTSAKQAVERSATCLVRVQIDLGPSLRSFASLPTTAGDDDLAPAFSFALALHFSSSALSAETAPDSSVRLVLPSITLPSAQHEENVVSVSSTLSHRLIELVSPPPVSPDETVEPPMSPLPASKGVARWSTLRTGATPTGTAPPPVQVDILSADASLAERVDTPPAPSPLASDWTGAEADFAEGLAASAREDETADLLDERAPSPSTAAPSVIEVEAPVTVSTTDEPPSASVDDTPPTTSFDDTPLAHVNVTITPVPPAPGHSLWEYYYEFEFTPAYTGAIASERSSADLTALAAWNEQGEACLETEPSEAQDAKGQRFRVERARRLVLVAHHSDGVRPGLGSILRLERQIVKLSVELVPLKGLISEPRRAEAIYASRTSTSLVRFCVPSGAPLGPFFTFRRAKMAGTHRLAVAPEAWTLPSLPTRLWQLLMILFALGIYYAIYAATSTPTLSQGLSRRQLRTTSVDATPAISSSSAMTSFLRTPHTVTTTATSTSTIISFITHTPASTPPVVHTTTLYRTTTIRQATPVTPTAPLAFDDSLPPATSATIIPRREHSLAREDAHSLVESFRVWLERVKLEVRLRWRDLLAFVM
ncbi:hypothetical protein NBRC10512_005611 [Rhodotorula toruloides]|uniref:RHTO0S15e01486g1_1 n=2 Tax=Rhodotorula toruloides TaxID=5286 RepID=A0A061BIN1_RHOTO|nr:uncharacterized protein RHTO_03240 [Rhodotorula toruloides NP11]EMS25511.1 hypothetical protein RHTO_03240 [Rhodotorula toruloides NP11]CDR47749.1 RHTO0S15e01486g1_1 [Rhodotorula toruloides]